MCEVKSHGVARAFQWLCRHPYIFAATQFLFLILICLLLQLVPAFAEGDGNGSMGALDFKDSSGHHISSYSIEYLYDVISTSVFKNSTLSLLIGIVWEGYKWMVGAAAALIDFTLNFSWIPFISSPAENLASVMQEMLDKIPGIRALLLALAVGIGVSKIYFGKASKGISEIIFAFLAITVAASFAMNPVKWLNEDNGPLEFVKQTGQEVSTTLIDPTGKKHLSKEDAASSLAIGIVDVFVRKPHQFVAYGGLVEGTKCEKTYNENLNKSPNELANAMLKCDEASYKGVIKDASFTALIAVLVVFVGGLILMAIAAVLAVLTLYEVANLIFNGVFLVWELFRAVGPGGSYRGVINSFLNMLASILGMLLSIIVLVLYLTIIIGVFNSKQDSIIIMFLIIDVMLFIGIALLFKFRRELAKKLAESKKLFGSSNVGNAPARVLQRGAQVGAGIAGAKYFGNKLDRLGPEEKDEMKAGSAIPKRSLARRSGDFVTAPARKFTRKISRPGEADVRRFRKLNKQSGSPVSGKEQKQAESLIYARAAKRWNAKQAKKQEKRQDRLLRKESNRAWTWAGAQKKKSETAEVMQKQGNLAPSVAKKHNLNTGSKMPGKKPKRRSMSSKKARTAATASNVSTTNPSEPSKPVKNSSTKGKSGSGLKPSGSSRKQ